MKKHKKIMPVVVFVLLFAFVFSANFALAMVDDSTSGTSQNTVTYIKLRAEGANISWASDGYSAKGFKVVWSKNSGPTYPLRSGDKYHYYSSPNQTSDTVTAFNGDGTYYVRVCEYLGGECGIYSNEVVVTLGGGATGVKEEVEYEKEEIYGDVTKIDLEASSPKVYWLATGKSTQGFKVVWSKNPNPTYPLRSGDKYHYYTDPYKDTDILTPFAGAGTYYVRVCEYLGGKCGIYSNQVTVYLQEGVKVEEKTETVNKDAEIIQIEERAQYLYEQKIDQLLAMINELQDTVREQAAEIKYLSSLLEGVSGLLDTVKEAINNFITYGVDDNTKKLGAGERAAVMYSYKQAFGKLPETEVEIEDAIKIANGRWPGDTNPDAELKAKMRFKEIYQRVPNMDNPNDNAAVVIMAYGLRQKAENRNLESEQAGIKIFKSIYGHVPSTTEEWNIMQAITYSGASR